MQVSPEPVKRDANDTAATRTDPYSRRPLEPHRAVALGGTAIGFAVPLGIVGGALVVFGKVPAILLIIAAVFLGWWGRSRIRKREPEIR
jgi:hypothetical protein